MSFSAYIFGQCHANSTFGIYVTESDSPTNANRELRKGSLKVMIIYGVFSAQPSGGHVALKIKKNKYMK